jgi:DNA-binding MarR family transcriptional regulator
MATAASSVETAEMLFGCVKRMRRLVDAELSECGLSLSRAKVLGALHRSGPLHQSALAVTFGLAPRTVTELVDTLERDGLVERRTDPADRRARLVELTPSGEEAHVRGAAIGAKFINRALSTLSDRQIAGLSTSLHLIVAELDKIDAGVGAGDTPCLP